MTVLRTGANILFGTWGDDFAKIVAKDVSIQAGLKTIPKAKGVFAQYKQLFKGSTWTNAKANVGFLNDARKAKSIGLLNSPLKTVKGAYTEANVAVKKAAAEAAKTGTRTRKGLLSRVGGALKKVPLLGAALTVAFEAPAVWRAFTDKENGGGFVEGFKQIGRSLGTVASYSLGFAAGGAAAGIIGQALCPIPGLGFVLGIAGGMLFDKLTKTFLTEPLLDKSIGEKEAEAAEAGESTPAQSQPPTEISANTTPYGNYTSNPSSTQNQFGNGSTYDNSSYDYMTNTGLSSDVELALNESNAKTWAIMHGQQGGRANYIG